MHLITNNNIEYFTAPFPLRKNGQLTLYEIQTKIINITQIITTYHNKVRLSD